MTEYEVLAEGISPREGDYIDEQSIGVVQSLALPEKIALVEIDDPLSEAHPCNHHQVYIKEPPHRGSPVVLKDLLDLLELCSKTLNPPRHLNLELGAWVGPRRSGNIDFKIYDSLKRRLYQFHFLKDLLSFLNKAIINKSFSSQEAEKNIAIGEDEISSEREEE